MAKYPIILVFFLLESVTLSNILRLKKQRKQKSITSKLKDMLNELMVVANFAIVFGVIYKLFELFVCKKERMMLIEKLPSEALSNVKIKIFKSSNGSYTPLRVGCLLMGLGIGLFVAYIIVYGTWVDSYKNGMAKEWMFRDLSGVIFGACVLIGGGMGLVLSYLIEIWRERLNKE